MAKQPRRGTKKPGADPATAAAQNTLDSLEDILYSQGDFNYVLKGAIQDLSKMDTSYGKIEARLASLNRDSINIKEVNKQLLNLRQKEYIESRKLQILQTKIDDKSKDILQSAKDQVANLKGANGQSLTKQETEKKMYEVLKQKGDLEAVQLYTAEKTLEISKMQTAQGEDTLKTEKEVSRQLGISGNLMKVFSEKIGFGEEAYEAMSKKSRELVEKQKDMNGGAWLFSKIIGGWKVAFAGAKSIVSSAFSSITDPVAILGGIGLFAKLLKDAFDYIVGIQDKTVKFARAMNMSTEQARQLKMQYADINVANGDLFVNTQKLVEAQMDMVSALGVTNQISTENLATNIKLKDIAGVEADTIASITESSIINGKSNESIVKSVFAQVKGLKQATGIQFENKQILKEASSLGGVLGLQFAKYPAQLTKSLLTVKAMGLELKQLDSMADSFLDFESSISKEFEAQLLTGKDINLAKARELFLDNDLAGAAAEINKQVGSSADFMKMKRIQQDAFAASMGMSRDQMGDMLKKQEMLSRLGAKDTDNSREQLRLGLAKYKNQKALSEAIGEENYQNLVNASLQEKIAAFMEKIKQSISDFVEKSGIIGKIENFFNYISNPDNIRKIIVQLRDFFANAVQATLSIANGIINAIDAITFGFGIDEEFERKFEKFSAEAPNKIRSMGGDLSMTAAKDRVGGAGGSSAAAAAPSSTKMGRPSGGDTITNNLILDGQIVTSTTNKVNKRSPHFDENTKY